MFNEIFTEYLQKYLTSLRFYCDDIYFAETRWDFYTTQSILHVYVINVRLSWTVFNQICY